MMLKRPGENLARTEDGATYNKLQRPDNWPAEPARISVLDDAQEEEKDYSDSTPAVDERGTPPESATPITRQKKKRIYSSKKTNANTAEGCLPMDDDDFSGSENGNVSFAAIQYLKSVRAEANDLPVVSAMKITRRLSAEDHRGYYEDGAYVVAPELGPTYPEEYEDEPYDEEELEEGEEAAENISNQYFRISACEAYTDALLGRFHYLRGTIRARQAQLASTASSSANGLQVPHMSQLRRIDRQFWEQTVNEQLPQPSAVAATSIESLLSIVFIIKEQCLPRKRNIHKNISLWLLVILASIDERTVDSDIMYDLRELAKKAIWLRIDHEPRFADASEAMGREAGYLSKTENGENGNSNDPTNVEQNGPERLQDDEMLSDLLVDETVPDDATKAMLDMIVTVLGEVFGQRDLLDSRAVVDWPQVDEDTAEQKG